MTAERPRFDSINPAAIAAVVERFYGEVRHDSVLGPIFARHVQDWTPHMLRMQAFWRSVLLRTGEFERSPRGAPPHLHAAIEGITADHFARWLTLFSKVLSTTLAAGPADDWEQRARGIGRSLVQRIPGNEGSLPLARP